MIPAVFCGLLGRSVPLRDDAPVVVAPADLANKAVRATVDGPLRLGQRVTLFYKCKRGGCIARLSVEPTKAESLADDTRAFCAVVKGGTEVHLCVLRPSPVLDPRLKSGGRAGRRRV